MKYLWWISVLFLASALPSAVLGATVTQDPCVLGVKSSTAWDISTAGSQEVVPAVAGKKIYVCNLVFSGSASENLQIAFEAGVAQSACGQVAAGFGGLSYNNGAVVSTGSGNSTQFTVPTGDSLCIVFSGADPLASSGWVVYVQR